ncbi:TonB-dependent receptor [Kangiella sp. TOML190]|uniref:TonB-dependent receptor n=1 Tax=Kangiella sp. TOML190 TaxID=2931351 RepID=UPI00203CB7A7|nr:TonB-dependent receptor [Kangiella sp. TOML190]
MTSQKFHIKKLAVAMALAFSGVSYAADDANDDDTSDENVIKVTAQKRVQRIQDVPLSISAVNEQMIVDTGSEDVNDILRFAPGVEGNNIQATQPNYTIRGITTSDFGVGSDPAVAVYVDGVYVGRGAASHFNFNDVERVEVLRGPQGTLFGRNAAAGAIHLITKKPTEHSEGKTRLTLGRYNKVRLETTYNSKLKEDLYFRGSLVTNNRDGWLNNLNGGSDLYEQDSYGANLKFLADVSDDTEALFIFDYDNLDQDARQALSLNPAISPADPFGSYDTDFDSNERRELMGGSLTITTQFDNFEFTSISAYRKYSSHNFQEEDGTAQPRWYFDSDNDEDQDQISQEFRITSTGEGPLQWTTGFTYFKEDVSQASVVNVTTNTLDTFFLTSAGLSAGQVLQTPLGTGWGGFLQQNLPNELAALSAGLGIPVDQVVSVIVGANLNRPWTEITDVNSVTESFAIYGDMAYSFNEYFDVTVGGRFTYDDKDFTIFSEYQNEIILPFFGVDNVPFGLVFFDQFSPAVQQKDHWSDFSPRVVFSYKPNRDHMFYISGSEGFKSGGFNSLGLDPAFDPEEVTSYEAGYKGSFADGRFTMSLSAFDYDTDNLQIFRLSGPQGAIPTYNIRNADAEGDGYEFEFHWRVTDNLNIAGNYSHLKTEYTRYAFFPGDTNANDLTGEPLSGMPEDKYNIFVDYYIPTANGDEWRFYMDYHHVSERAHNSGLDASRIIDGYDISNVKVSWTNSEGDLTIGVFANNVFDEEYLYFIGGQAEVLDSPVSQRGEPRMFGINFTWSY